MKTPPTFPDLSPRANPQQPASTLTLARKDLFVHRRATPLDRVLLSDINRPVRELQKAELVVLVDPGNRRRVLKSRLPEVFVAGGAQ